VPPALELTPNPEPNVQMGIEKQLIKEGSGPYPTKGQKVTVSPFRSHLRHRTSRAGDMMMIAQIRCGCAQVHCTGYGKNNDLTQKFWRCVSSSVISE
jgi:hypothetical protein